MMRASSPQDNRRPESHSDLDETALDILLDAEAIEAAAIWDLGEFGIDFNEQPLVVQNDVEPQDDDVLDEQPLLVQNDVEPQEDDVLCARGHQSNTHPGTQRYFSTVKNQFQKSYRQAQARKDNQTKRAIVEQVISSVSGRFLKQDPETKCWYVLSSNGKVVYNKVSQALRDNHSKEARKVKRDNYQVKKNRAKQQK